MLSLRHWLEGQTLGTEALEFSIPSAVNKWPQRSLPRILRAALPSGEQERETLTGVLGETNSPAVERPRLPLLPLVSAPSHPFTEPIDQLPGVVLGLGACASLEGPSHPLQITSDPGAHRNIQPNSSRLVLWAQSP